MNSETPAREIRPKDLAANVAAFEVCLDHLPQKGIGDVLDIRYGLGEWAKALSLVCPSATIHGFEMDRETFCAAARPARSRLLHRPFDPLRIPKSWPQRYDLLCADFNTLTLLKAEHLRQAVVATSPRFLIFTDVACSKLHLNFKSYGLKNVDNSGLDRYFSAFRMKVLPGWELKHVARLHYHAATTAWVRRKKL